MRKHLSLVITTVIMAVIGLCCIMGQSFHKPTEKVSASAIKVPSSNIEFTDIN